MVINRFPSCADVCETKQHNNRIVRARNILFKIFEKVVIIICLRKIDPYLAATKLPLMSTKKKAGKKSSPAKKSSGKKTTIRKAVKKKTATAKSGNTKTAGNSAYSSKSKGNKPDNEKQNDKTQNDKAPKPKSKHAKVGFGKILTLPPDGKLKVLKTNKFHQSGDVINYHSSFFPVIGNDYFFTQTPVAGVVELLGSGRGTVISIPPPGLLRVDSPSIKHQVIGERVTYYSSSRPAQYEQYPFYDTSGSAVQV